MTRNQLRLAAAILTTLIIAVGLSAFDHLPGSLRKQIDAERAALTTAQTQIRSEQETVTRDVQSDPALFRNLAVSQQWPGGFQQASDTLQSASGDMSGLTRLEQHGHRRDQQRAEALLAHERILRNSALNQASSIQTDAARWIDRKQHLPEEIRQMEQSYTAIHAFDFGPVTAAVMRAETDWPEKKTDLEGRLAALKGIAGRDEDLWQTSAGVRREAASADTANVDYGRLLTDAEELKSDAASLPQKSSELQSLTGQLYDSWDKVLVDMEVRGIGANRAWDQRIRTVRTHGGSTTSQEQWVGVSQAAYDAMRNDLGMAIEHKPTGKYDFEAEHVAQPAGFAYVAPLSQGSNQYGYWEHRDGQSFWVFYGQYALLRDLLFNHSYRPLPSDEWEEYRSYRTRGQTYYGHDAEGTPKYGSSGTATQERYSGSTYARSGGFRNSPYASKSGGFRNSPYASREESPKRFGARPAPEPSFHPSPRPSFRLPSGGGRRFGGRRR
jgi:hypothetical protein